MGIPSEKSPKINRTFTFTNTFVSNIELTDKEQVYSDKKLTGLKVRVGKYPRGLKVFYLYYKIAGKQQKKRIGKFPDISVPAAREAVQQLNARRALGEDVQATHMETRAELMRESSVKLRAFLDDHYYPWIGINEKKKGHQKNPIRTKQILENTFKHFHNKRMDQITRADMDKWSESRLSDGIKPSTINRCATVLIACLNRAVEWNIIKFNPLRGRKRLKLDSQGVVRYLSEAEETRLLKALETREGNIALLIPLLLNTGARPREALSLTWDNVDLERRQITLLASFTKTGQTRHIPINEKLYKILSMHKKIAGTPWLFPNQSNTGPIVTIQKAWKNLKKDAELKNFRLYDCRHTFASYLVMRGVDIVSVSRLMGHSDIKMTMKYVHLAPEHLQAAVDVL